MKFKADIFSLEKSNEIKFTLPGDKFPREKDVFFRAKQQELVEQYSAARIFLCETETDDWGHWFEPVDYEIARKYFQLTYRSHFYETALFYYNAVVDISWTLCYVAVEFACSKNGVRVNMNGIKPVEEAIGILRSAERNVTSPTAEDNPFDYFRMMCPEFAPAIDIIVSFWNEFSCSEIRKRYNFCKHKGRPAYDEIEQLTSSRIMKFYRKSKNSSKVTQLVSNVKDVRYSFSLEQAIVDLQKFDDAVLYPYIEKLIRTIEEILQPSPMIL